MFCLLKCIENRTRVVISYEIYETNFVDHECKILFIIDPLKLDFIAFKIGNISSRKRIVNTDVFNGVTRSRQSVISRVVIRFL